LFSGIPYEVEPHPGIEVVHVSPQDCLQLYYKYWLFSESVVGNIPLFSDPYEFATPGARGFTSQQFPVSALFALLAPISPVFAYNVIVLLSFAGCGLFMLKLAHARTGDWPASLIAGLIFCIMPFRLPQLMAGHPNGVAVCFVPLTLCLVMRAGEKRSPALSVCAGLVFSGIALLDMQLAFFSSILIALFVAYETVNLLIRRNRETTWQGHLSWIASWLLPMAIGAAPGLVYLGFMKLVILKASAIHGAGATDFRIGPAFKDLWDMTVCGERRIYVGPWVAMLALAGLILPALRRSNRRELLIESVAPLFWALTVLAGLVLSLSLNPPFDRIVDRIPIARLSRTPARATIITFTGLSLLAAYALTSARRMLGERKLAKPIYAALVALAALLIAHNYWLHGPRGINILSASSPIYERITREAPDARVLAAPIWPGDSAMSASLFHHIVRSKAHLLNGYSPVASTEYRRTVFDPFKHVNVGQFAFSEWETAQALGVTHVTFHPESFPSPGHVSVFPADLTLERLKQAPALEWVCHDDPVDLFRLGAQPEIFTAATLATSPIGISIPGRHSDIAGNVKNDPTSIMRRVLTRQAPGTNAVFVCHGRIYPAGNYRVSLRLKAIPSPETRLNELTWSLRAFLSEDGGVLSERVFSGDDLPGTDSYGWVEFPLELPQAGRVGFEMSSSSFATFALDLWHMIFSECRDRFLYEAEDLFHVGRVISVEGAGGRGVVQVNDSDPTEGVVRGPYRVLAAGHYVVSVRLRGETPISNQALATVYVTGRTSPIRPALGDFASSDWRTADKAAAFSIMKVPFSVPEPGTVIECRIDRCPGATLEIDSVEISSPAKPFFRQRLLDDKRR